LSNFVDAINDVTSDYVKAGLSAGRELWRMLKVAHQEAAPGTKFNNLTVACPVMACCRVDDTSPERAVVGLSAG